MRKNLSAKHMALALRTLSVLVGVALIFADFVLTNGFWVGLPLAATLCFLSFRIRHIEFDGEYLYVRTLGGIIQIPLQDVDRVENYWMTLKKRYPCGKVVFFTPESTGLTIPGQLNTRRVNELKDAVKQAKAPRVAG